MALSVPLVAEYEAVSKRMLEKTYLSLKDLEDILDYLCQVGRQQKIFFLWRPFLPDPGDDMVLELAVAAGSRYIITFNQRNFSGCEQFGIEPLTPREFLVRIGELP